MIDWMNEWMTERNGMEWNVMKKWHEMSEWMNEWMNDMNDMNDMDDMEWNECINQRMNAWNTDWMNDWHN